MKIKLDPKLKNALLLGKLNDNTPFTLVDGKYFIQYDSFSLESGAFGVGLKMHYLWKGKKIAHFEVDDFVIEGLGVLIVEQMSGTHTFEWVDE